VTNQTPHYQRSSAWSRLKPGQRVAIILVGLLLPCCGGLTLIGALVGGSGSADKKATADAQQVADAGATSQTTGPAGADATEPTVDPTTTATTAAAAPVVETRTVSETQKIAYKSRTVNDSSINKGTKRVRTKGVAGAKTLTYEVTVTDGKQTAKKLISTTVTRQPVTEVVAVGTKVDKPSGCDPNYSGACVPIASDVDCAGGSGNGPAYVQGPVRVVGTDIYKLDRDGDGIACDT
jgi:hypothetical protein